MTDSEVENISTHVEPDSPEDLTVYEVITEYQGAPSTSNTNYPHIFLQLREGQIINVETGEIIINLSQFIAVEEPTEPREGDTTSVFSSQTSPRSFIVYPHSLSPAGRMGGR